MNGLIEPGGANGPVDTAGTSGNVRAADWFYRSKIASVLWLAARLSGRPGNILWLTAEPSPELS